MPSFRSSVTRGSHPRKRLNASSADTTFDSPMSYPASKVDELKTMADRVTVQVEQFAVEIDKWVNDRGNGEEGMHHSTIELVHSLGKIAKDAFEEGLKIHGDRMKRQAESAWGKKVAEVVERRSPSARASSESGEDDDNSADAPIEDLTPIEDLIRWQDEANTWQLLGLVLEQTQLPPGVDLKAQKARDIAEFGPVHRWTKEADIWNIFLIGDDTARERRFILRWLEETADQDGGNVDLLGPAVDANVEKIKAFDPLRRPLGSGWMYTREAIKAEKRNRLQDRPLEPDNTSLSTSGNTGILVTQLDPDAPNRQDRQLEDPDAMTERLIWMWIWQMLRRGKTWAEVRQWCQDRGETWRALSLGMSHDQGTNSELRTNLHGGHCGSLHRRMCHALGTEGTSDLFERAVYGLIAGDLMTVEPVCESWDDQLYASLNALLLSQFDEHLRENYPERLPASLFHQFKIFDAVQYFGDVTRANAKIVANLFKTCNKEAVTPLKMIQGTIIAKTFDTMAYNVGYAISAQANAHGQSSKFFMPVDRDTDRAFHVAASDPNSLRMLAHMIPILQALGPQTLGLIGGEDQRQWIYENVIVAYMDVLRMTGKIELISTYAKLLSPDRIDMTLGRMLIDVTSPREQKFLVKLIEENGINVTQVLLEQVYYTVGESTLIGDDAETIERFDLLEPTPLRSLEWPGFRIRDNVMGSEITEEEETCIRSAEWFLFLSAVWDYSFMAMSFVMKRLLLSGRVTAALELFRRLPFKTVSEQKTPFLIGSRDGSGPGINVWTDELDGMDVEPEPPRRSTRASSARPTANHRQQQTQTMDELRCSNMREESRTYYELEQLVNAIHALNEWRKEEDDIVLATRQGSMSNHERTNLRARVEDVNTAMTPLLGDFLTHPITEEEDAELKAIRHAYMPSVILAYISVLHFAGTLLTRDHMLTTLDLATVIAAPQNAALAESFTATGRMGELVEAFAKSSRDLLRLNELHGGHRSKSKKRGGDGRTVEIWESGAKRNRTDLDA